MKKLIAIAFSLGAILCFADEHDFDSGALRLKAKGMTINLITSIYNDGDILYATEADESQNTEVILGWTCRFSPVEYYIASDNFYELQTGILDALNERIKSAVGSASKATFAALAADVISYNNAAMVTAVTDLMNTAIENASGVTENDLKKITDVQKEMQNLSTKIKDIQSDKSLNDSLNNFKSSLAQSINKLTAEINSVRNSMQSTTDAAEIAALRKEVDSKMAKLDAKLISLTATITAQDNIRDIKTPDVVVLSGGDIGFTNFAISVSRFLGAEEVTNSLAFTPPKLKSDDGDDGDDAQSIIDYLDSYGVLTYANGRDGGFSRGFNESAGTSNVTATFSAPSNWADGRTIICTNGVYEALPPNLSTPWHWMAGSGFLRPYVFAGNQVISATGASTALRDGEWYVHVSASTINGSTTYSASVNQTSTAADDEWVFWVGTIEAGECTAELAVMPLILCYQ